MSYVSEEAGKMSPGCKEVSDDSLIALQRQLLAVRLMEARGIVTPSSALPKPAHAGVVNATPMKKVRLPGIQHYPHSAKNDFMILPVVSKPPPSPPRKTYRNEGYDEHSVSTATMSTMTHEPAPPLHLPTFKPALGCISVNDFMIRCFVARLRSGVTVVKHGRSRFQWSPRTYVLKLEEDGESLTWQPSACKVAMDSSSSHSSQQQSTQSIGGTSTSSSRSKRLKLSECREVRLALTPDPENPNYTGTATLRDKCDASDAHKSFALVFEDRTLDITSITADQCKMLTEGFSALCYRLHLKEYARERHDRYVQCPDEDEDRTRRGCFRLVL